MDTRIGELAALITAVSWTTSAMIMEVATRRAGVMAVNTLKVAFGTLYLAILAWILHGSILPQTIDSFVWLIVGSSGLVGFVIGDYFLLHAYALIGSRLTMLLLSISVPLTAVGAWLIFNEKLGAWAIAGIVATTAGIVMTVMAGRAARTGADSAGHSRTDYRKGVIFGLLSALALAVATLLTKAGIHGVDTISATQIRILSALVGFLVFAMFTRKTREIKAAVVAPQSLGLIALGAIFGPFIGVGCLLFALQHAEAGVVSTLSSLSPVLIIPPSILIFKKRVAVAEIIGACIAMVGVVWLFI